MTLTDTQRQKLNELAAPLAQWMLNNFHPHVTIIVKPTTVEMMEGIAANNKLDVEIPD